MNHGGNEVELALVIRSRSGDRAAFEQLVRNTARGLYTRIYLDVPNAHRAEDLVQEVYLRAWKHLDGLSDPKAFRGWLMQIAQAVILDEARSGARKKRGRARTKNESPEMLEVPDPAASPQELIEQAEQRREMLQLLKSLPEEYQQVLSLRYLTGADYQEIGKQLAISNGSLRGLLSRGMKLLREKMQKTDLTTEAQRTQR